MEEQPEVEVEVAAAAAAAAVTGTTNETQTPAVEGAHSPVLVADKLQQALDAALRTVARLRSHVGPVAQSAAHWTTEKIKLANDAINETRAKLPEYAEQARQTLVDARANLPAPTQVKRKTLDVASVFAPDLTRLDAPAVPELAPDVKTLPLAAALHSVLVRMVESAKAVATVPTKAPTTPVPTTTTTAKLQALATALTNQSIVRSRNATTFLLADAVPKLEWSESWLLKLDPAFNYLESKGVRKDAAHAVVMLAGLVGAGYLARKTWRLYPRQSLDILSALPASYLVLSHILSSNTTATTVDSKSWLSYYLVLSLLKLADYKYDPTAVGSGVAAVVLEEGQEMVATRVPSWWMLGKLVVMLWMLRGGRKTVYDKLIALSTKLTTPTTTTTTTTLPPPFTTQPHILPSAPSFSLAPIALPDLHPRPTLDHSDFETPMRQPASTYIDRNRGFDDDEEELSAGEEANLRMRGKRGERKSPEGVQRPGVSGNQRY